MASVEAMAWHMANRMARRNPGVDVEDLAAEVRAGFVRSAQTFDPGRGFKFTTYCCRLGNRFGLAFVQRSIANGVHTPANQFVRVPVGSLTFDGEDGPEQFDLADARPAGPAFPPGWWEEATRTLHRRERVVILGRFRDARSLNDLAAELGVSKERVRQVEQRAVDKLRTSRGDLADWLPEAS